jgi:Mg-chelatase subunit ChlD
LAMTSVYFIVSPNGFQTASTREQSSRFGKQVVVDNDARVQADASFNAPIDGPAIVQEIEPGFGGGAKQASALNTDRSTELSDSVEFFGQSDPLYNQAPQPAQAKPNMQESMESETVAFGMTANEEKQEDAVEEDLFSPSNASDKEILMEQPVQTKDHRYAPRFRALEKSKEDLGRGKTSDDLSETEVQNLGMGMEGMRGVGGVGMGGMGMDIEIPNQVKADDDFKNGRDLAEKVNSIDITKNERVTRRDADVSGPWDVAENASSDQPRRLPESKKSLLPEIASLTEARQAVDEMLAIDEPFSTFSLHVGDVSFRLAQSSLSSGQWPEPTKIRIEEFVNAFDYGDPVPSESEKVACQVEQSAHPFMQQRNVMRVSMRTAATGRATNTPLRLTLLLDNSGSMERADRQKTVRRAVRLLTDQLTASDQVTLISFARAPRLLADKVVGDQASPLVSLIEQLPSEGGTNIEASLQLALEKSLEQKSDDAQNRIVLLTDGAVNLGDADPESLSKLVTRIRDSGIAFDAAGIDADGLNDEVLEALTRQGDGRYYLLDSVEAADDRFARQIAGALRPAAKNVKVQVEFNPSRVGRYKLLGFEKYVLNQEDFRNDKVDAAELAAAEAGVALYQFEAKPDGEGDVGSVSVRFQDLSTGEMIEKRWPIPYEAQVTTIDQATASLRIATAAAIFASKLRGEPGAESVDFKMLARLVSGSPQSAGMAKQVEQLQLMIQQSQQISGQ